MAIDILMYLCILKFINLAPCLFVISLTEFNAEEALRAAVFVQERRGPWLKNVVHQNGFLGIYSIPICGCSLQRYVPLDWFRA